MTRRSVRVALLLCLWGFTFNTACGRDKATTPGVPTAPSAPVTPVAPVPPPVPVTSVQGTVRVTNDGASLVGAAVSLFVAGPVAEDTPVATAVTDAAGGYRLTYQRAATFMRLSVSGDGLITRNAYLEAGRSRQADIDVFREDVTFHLRDYRVIARNAFYETTRYLATYRLVNNPILYVRTVDDANQLVDPANIELAISTISSSIGPMTGGKLALSGIERGTELMPYQELPPGYLLVYWPIFDQKSGSCGAYWGSFGSDSATVALVAKGCGCGGKQIDTGVIRHRLGHALGLGDTRAYGEVMYSNLDYSQDLWGGSMCDVKPTPQEQRYGRYLYSRPKGNLDPDDDPQFSILP